MGMPTDKSNDSESKPSESPQQNAAGESELSLFERMLLNADKLGLNLEGLEEYAQETEEGLKADKKRLEESEDPEAKAVLKDRQNREADAELTARDAAEDERLEKWEKQLAAENAAEDKLYNNSVELNPKASPDNTPANNNDTLEPLNLGKTRTNLNPANGISGEENNQQQRYERQLSPRNSSNPTTTGSILSQLPPIQQQLTSQSTVLKTPQMHQSSPSPESTGTPSPSSDDNEPTVVIKTKPTTPRRNKPF